MLRIIEKANDKAIALSKKRGMLADDVRRRHKKRWEKRKKAVNRAIRITRVCCVPISNGGISIARQCHDVRIVLGVLGALVAYTLVLKMLKFYECFMDG